MMQILLSKLKFLFSSRKRIIMLGTYIEVSLKLFWLIQYCHMVYVFVICMFTLFEKWFDC